MKEKRINQVLRLTIMAMLTAVSIVILYAVPKFPFPFAPAFLEYDAADVPVLIGAMMLGPVPGLIILFAVCLIQAVAISSTSGIIGFFMHFIASSALILIPSIIYRRKKTVTSLIIGLVLGVVGMAIVMIPLNLIFTGIFMGTGVKAVAQMLIPAIIPFNLAKGSINAVATFVIFTPVSQVLKRYIKI